MADKTGIAWADSTWNPIRGCSRVSEGCRFCYAEQQALRHGGTNGPYARVIKGVRLRGQTVDGVANPVVGRWTGTVEVADKAEYLPLQWGASRWIFVNSMSDLFHEQLPRATIDKVFAIMALAPQHHFIVLTKRHRRLAEYSSQPGLSDRVRGIASLLAEMRGKPWLLERPWVWPLPNVILGVSVEDKETAWDRISVLAGVSAACRVVSFEPLLEPIDYAEAATFAVGRDGKPAVGWAILGGESGPQARPYDVAHALEAVALFRRRGVPVFHKQLGSNPLLHGRRLEVAARKGDVMLEWPTELRVQQRPVLTGTAWKDRPLPGQGEQP